MSGVGREDRSLLGWGRRTTQAQQTTRTYTVNNHVMTAASIGVARGGGYARYLESKTVEPEHGDYYLTPDGEKLPMSRQPAPAAALPGSSHATTSAKKDRTPHGSPGLPKR